MNRITRRIISVLLSLALIFTGINLQADNAKADDADSIKISTAEQLALIGKDENYPLDGNYTLENNIDNVTFTIGQTENNYPDSFTGTFDGNGHSVTLNINAEKTYQGLFGTINGATVKNVVVKGSITQQEDMLQESHLKPLIQKLKIVVQTLQLNLLISLQQTLVE
jgi:hypothetical protein